MDKRTLILDALQALLREGKAGTASVADIAKKAGIAKGGMYYYFKSKEDALDALANRQYAAVIQTCEQTLAAYDVDAITKLKLLLSVYRSTAVDSAIDAFLHQTNNAAIHQKSMADILHGLTPLVADILAQGVREGIFTCAQPDAFAEIMLSALVFLLDPGIFTWTQTQIQDKLKALACLMERGLCAQEGCLSFLAAGWSQQTLS